MKQRREQIDFAARRRAAAVQAARDQKLKDMAGPDAEYEHDKEKHAPLIAQHLGLCGKMFPLCANKQNNKRFLGDDWFTGLKHSPYTPGWH